MSIAEVLEKIPVSGIRRLFELASKMPEVINLGIGEPDFDTPEHIKKAAVEALEEGYTHYTSNAGLPELREAIAKKLKKDNGIEASVEEIIVTVGGEQALANAIFTLIKPGDEVLIPSPAFVSYRPLIQMAGGAPVEVPVREENDFCPVVEDLKKYVTGRTKAIIINTPCNPTGAVYPRKVLEEVADFAVEHDLTVISDEAYEKIVFEGNHVSIASLNGMKDRVVSVFTFSKTYAMTGWRLGYAVARKDIIDRMVKLNMYVIACPVAFAQKAALAALEGPQDCVEKMVSEYRRRIDLVFRRLSEMPDVSVIKPKGTFYIFPNISRYGKSEEVAEQLLYSAKVAVVPGSAFGKYGEGYLRISCATSYEKLAEAMDRIEEWMKSYGSGKTQ
ncbi:MAG: pyridoxal phosphate-dependent aminotransferase [Desulfurococcales archaeon]|nr:pyridoxal phosphate-dependent aminotransferase [Desulfurococcales archaeon]